jgi:hypothetical protein
VVLVGVFWAIQTRPFSPEGLIGQLETSDSPFFAAGSGWEDPGWSRLRGTTIEELLGTEQIAFRAGVRAIDLEVAKGRGQTDLADHLAIEVGSLLRALGDSEALGQPRELERHLEVFETASARSERAESLRHLLELLGRHPQLGSVYLTGQWAELGRLGSRARELEILQNRPFRRFCEEAIDADRRGVARAELERIASLVQKEIRPEEQRELRASFARVVATLGG